MLEESADALGVNSEEPFVERRIGWEIRGERVSTVPNLISLMRLALVPVFIYTLLVAKADCWAVVILFFSGFSDWLDGKLARLLDQSSSLGALLDPLADRIYIATIPLAFGVRGFIPWWIVAVIFARELFLAAQVPLLRKRGLVALPTLYIGKAATFALMSAFPCIFIGQLDSWIGGVAIPLGWALLIWGVVLYLWTLVLYWYQILLLIRKENIPVAHDPHVTDMVIVDEGKASG